MDTLTLNISSPAHAPHTFTVTVSRQCSILELKEIIVTRLDTKLSIADQRLIFRGRILEDKETLDHVFEKVDCTEAPPTIHLVVSLRFRGTTQSSAAATAPSAQNTAATSATNLNTHNTFTPFATTTTSLQDRTESTNAETSVSGSTPSYLFTGSLDSAYAQFTPAQLSLQQPMQYVLVNGMPYLVPAAYLPMLHQQQCMQQTRFFAPYPYYGAVMMNADGMPYIQPVPAAFMGDHTRAATGDGVAAAAADGNAQDHARDQRRAASLWLLMKLAFGIYLFSQNGSIERIVLLHIAALIIFLHQTGRLRIVRRIGQPPADGPQQDHARNAGQQTTAPPTAQAQQTTTTTTTTTTTFTSPDNNNPLNGHEQTGSGSSSASSSSNPTATSSHVTSSHTQSAPSNSANSTVNSTSAAENTQGSQSQLQEGTPQQPRVSTWRSIEHALLTFVTSLVPAPPPEIDPAVANAAAAGERGM